MKHVIFIISLLLFACSNPTVTFNDHYNASLVLHAFLYPQDKIEIYLKRDFPVNFKVSKEDLWIKNASVKLIDENTKIETILSFNEQTKSYENAFINNQILYDRNYRIEVEANLDGQVKTIWARTQTVKNNLQLSLPNPVDLNNLKMEDYPFSLSFETINNSSYYRFVILSKSGKLDDFMWDNPYIEIGDKNDAEVLKELANNLQFYIRSDFSLSFLYEKINYIQSMDLAYFYFYGKNDIILFAGNNDYKNYFSTYSDLKDIDGNYAELSGNVSGDGFGVFASAISDTVSIEIKR